MNREKELLARMAGTIVTIVICLAAMGFSAFAYFSHSISSGVNVIQSAHFDVIVTEVTGVTSSTDEAVKSDSVQAVDVADETEATGATETLGTTETAGMAAAAGQGGVVLAGNVLQGSEAKMYTFKIQPAGNAETGYCKIVISEGEVSETFYTTQLFRSSGENNDQLTEILLKINVPQGCTITFTPQWGTSKYYLDETEILYGVKGNEEIDFSKMTEGDEAVGESGVSSENGTENTGSNDVQNGEVVTESDGGENTYTVVSGDTLSAIASKYNTTVDVLADLNGIENADRIKPGQVLNIPTAEGVESGETEAVVDATEEIGVTEAVSTTAPTEVTGAESTTAPTESTEAESTTAPTEATEAESTTAPTESSSTAVE